MKLQKGRMFTILYEQVRVENGSLGVRIGSPTKYSEWSDGVLLSTSEVFSGGGSGQYDGRQLYIQSQDDGVYNDGRIWALQTIGEIRTVYRYQDKIG